MSAGNLRIKSAAGISDSSALLVAFSTVVDSERSTADRQMLFTEGLNFDTMVQILADRVGILSVEQAEQATLPDQSLGYDGAEAADSSAGISRSGRSSSAPAQQSMPHSFLLALCPSCIGAPAR